MYQPDIVVYPEDARFIKALPLLKQEKIIETLFPNTVFIDGDTLKGQGGTYSNVSVYYDTAKHTTTYAHKVFMFPLNEYIPYIFMPLFHFFINQELLTTFMKDHSYVSIFSERSHLHNGIRLATLLCSEMVSLAAIKHIQKESPNIVFFQAQLILFDNSPIYAANMRSFTKVAAATLRRPVITSANKMPSYIISPYGTIVDTLSTASDTKRVVVGIYAIERDTIVPLIKQ